MSNRRSKIQNRKSRSGFTLVEVLIATAVTLVLMGLVVQIFAVVGDNVADTRATIQMVDRLRSVRQTLESDLGGVTCPLTPPLDPIDGSGYVEIVEGPIGSRLFPAAAPIVIGNGAGLSVFSNTPPGDTTLGDTDDMLMLTTHTDDDPFTGRMMYAYPLAGGGFGTNVTTTTSQDAEVCWFLRGGTLYRRMLLVKPSANVVTTPSAFSGYNFYAVNDVSVHQQGGSASLGADPYAIAGLVPANEVALVANSLSDLTNRQSRYGHQPFGFPYDARFWGPLGLPTLRDCTFYNTNGFVWPFPLFDSANTFLQNLQGQLLTGPNGPILFPNPATATVPYSVVPPTGNLPSFPQIPQIWLTVQQGNTGGVGQFDLWSTNSSPIGPSPWDQTDNVTGTLYYFSGYNSTNPPGTPPGNSRLTEDVVLTNVISFDVRVWDPQAPIVGHPGPDGLPGIATVDDDLDGTIDNFSELGALNSDDIVLAPGDMYIPPQGMPAPNTFATNPFPVANAWDYSTATPLANLANWANTQYLAVLTMALSNTTTPPTPTLPQIIRRGAYVDLSYGQNPAVPTTFASPMNGSLLSPPSILSGPGDFRSQLWAGGPSGAGFFVMPAVYDTGSTSYEQDGLDEDFVTSNYQLVGALGYSAPTLPVPQPGWPSYGPDQGRDQVDENFELGPDDTSGEPYFDVNGNGMFDDGPTNFTDLNANGQYDPAETEAPPPYRVPLQGIQVRIRVFDPDSRQIREVTVTQEFDIDN